MSRPPDPDDFRLDAFFPYRINVLAARVSRRLAAVYGERFGLSIPEWRVIAHLAEGGTASIREIHRKVDMDKPKVSRAAQRLERAGLIGKAVDPDDRRLVRLWLTDRGQQVFAAIVPLAEAFERDLMATLDAGQRAVLMDVIERLERVLDRDDADMAALDGTH